MMRVSILLLAVLIVVNAGALSSFKYTGVGGSGSYNMVVRADPGVFPNCNVGASAQCGKQAQSVSGTLSPFDDEVSVVFRGPMNIYKIAVYQPVAGVWSLVSYWDPSMSKPSNMVFLNNKGGDNSGTWSICQGNSQSFCNGGFNGTVSSANAEKYGTYLGPADEFNIMTATSCDQSPCTGFSRGTAYHGWSGSKMFVIEYNMPNNPHDASQNVPAIWVLNAQVLRSAQYGCNCRVVGADGGCGELDLVEVIPNTNISQAISQIYSYKYSTGSGGNNFWERPYTTPRTLTTTFDMATDSIYLRQAASFSLTPTISFAQMTAYNSQSFDQTVSVGAALFPTSGNGIVPNLPNLLSSVALTNISLSLNSTLIPTAILVPGPTNGLLTGSGSMMLFGIIPLMMTILMVI